MKASVKRGFVLLAALSAGGVVAANGADYYGTSEDLASGVILTQNDSVIGKDLVGPSGERVGRIVDVLADGTGKVRAAVVDYGGFLGVGARKIAVAWSDLRFGPEGDARAVATDLPRETLSQAPEVRAGRPVVAISAHEASRAIKH
jgi:hypothetical protein